MKKNGRKYRRIQKEKEIKRIEAEKRAGKPYSKHKIRVCRHWEGYSVGFGIGHVWSILYPISKEKCVCLDCGIIYSIDVYNKMKTLIEEFNNNYMCTTIHYYSERIQKMIKPVSYYYVAENMIEYTEQPEENPCEDRKE
nr:hypothetical protein [Eubacterium sp.]